MIKPEKRDEIVRAALELIAEKGFHASPMAELAKRAGVGAGTGALLGVIGGKTGKKAGIGAVVGGVAGGGMSVYKNSKDKDNVYKNCMRGRGYKVLN